MISVAHASRLVLHRKGGRDRGGETREQAGGVTMIGRRGRERAESVPCAEVEEVDGLVEDGAIAALALNNQARRIVAQQQTPKLHRGRGDEEEGKGECE
jgi:hypothetical protein